MPRPLALALLVALVLLGLAGLAPATAQVIPLQLYLPQLAVELPSPTTMATATATTQPTATATATVTAQPAPTSTGQPAPNCHPSYPTVCIPPPPPDLNCGDISFRRFAVIGSDPHNFDIDNDGIGCEGA
jgi:hypothetical protein